MRRASGTPHQRREPAPPFSSRCSIEEIGSMMGDRRRSQASATCMNGADRFLFVSPPHLQPPMAQVLSAIRELIRFVPTIFLYSIFLSFRELLPQSRSPSAESFLLLRREWSDLSSPLLESRCARFSICRITAEKSCSAPSSDCLELISKAAPVAGICAPTVAARSRINPKSLFISRIGNCGL